MYRHPGSRHSLLSVVIFCGCLTLSFACYGQRDSIRDEILQHTVPHNELIIRGRQMILNKIVEGDRKKVRQVMTYLIDSTEDKDYIAFNPFEKCLLYYWSGQYDQIMSDTRDFEGFLRQAEGRRIPIQDALMRDVIAKVGYERLKIQMDINGSDLSAMQKAFLVLNLDYLAETENTVRSQESINDACNGFMSLHPNSEFEPYIRKYLRFQYKASKWGYDYEFFTGYGIFTGDLSKQFTNTVPIGIAFDLHHSKFVLFLRVYIGFGLTRDSISFPNGTWRRDDRVEQFLPEASLGYKVYSNNALELTPFVGIGSMKLTPPPKDKDKIPEYKHVGLDYTTTFMFGLNLDLKLESTRDRVWSTGGDGESYVFVRIRYAYNHPQFDRHYTGFGGSFHNLTIGIGLFGRRAIREH